MIKKLSPTKAVFIPFVDPEEHSGDKLTGEKPVEITLDSSEVRLMDTNNQR